MKTVYTRTELREIAKYDRLIVWSVAANIFIVILLLSSRLSTGIDYKSLIVIITQILFGLFQAFCLSKLLKLLNQPRVFLLAFIILSFMPKLPVLAFLILLSRITKARDILRENGIEIGVMGTNPNSIRD